MNINDDSIKQIIFDLNDISQMFTNSVDKYNILYCSDSNFDYDLYKVSKNIMSSLSDFDNKNSHYTFSMEPIDTLSLLKSNSIVYIGGKQFIQIGILLFPSGEENTEKYYKSFCNNNVSLSIFIDSIMIYKRVYKREWKVIYKFYNDIDNVVVI